MAKSAGSVAKRFWASVDRLGGRNACWPWLGYRDKRGYGQSKLAQVSMTNEIAGAFARDGITMISLHPATLMDTTMVKGLGIPARTTVAAKSW